MRPGVRTTGGILSVLGFLCLACAVATTTAAAPLVFVTTSLPDAKYGNSYSAQVQASGGTAPYSFYVDPLTLPLGLRFNESTGAFLEAPLATPGIYPVTIRVRDSSAPQQMVERLFTIAVFPGIRVIGLPDLPPGNVGSSYSYQFSADGGKPPYRYEIPSGGQPPGLLMGSTSGALSGTPTVMGSYVFRVTCTDAAGVDGYADFRLNITGLPFTMTPTTLADGRVGVLYPTVTFAAGGGAPPYRFTLNSGGLPVGMSLSEQGVLSGTPTAQGGYPFEVKVTDSIGNYWLFTLSILVRPGLVVAPDTLPDGNLNTPYGVSLAANGFLDDVTLSIVSGTLPPGLQLRRVTAESYVIEGTPGGAGTYGFTIQARDSSQRHAHSRVHHPNFRPRAAAAGSVAAVPPAGLGRRAVSR